MSKFDALYKQIILEQPVQPPAHAQQLLPQIEMIGDIVKRQGISKQSAVIDSIMRGITDPKNIPGELSSYGTELPELVKKVGSYIASQPVEHRTDVIELVRQSASHPQN
jgi:hypothetical protein